MNGAARPWRRALAWLALLGPLFYASYGLANHLAAARAAVPSAVFDWERSVPFLDWTIAPYWSLNLFYAASPLLARTRHELDRHVARLLTAQVVAVTCFILWPLQFSFGQPAVQGWPALFFDALRGFDRPYNQAPSLHIVLVLILWDFYRRLLAGRAARLLLALWMGAIAVSVLTTWQHHFIDIPTGALVGLLCIWAWPLERRVSMAQAWRLTRDAQRRRLAAAYAVGAVATAAAALAVGGAALGLLWVTAALALVALNYLGFGARGFGMDRQGRMHWSARVLLLPYRLAARLNGWLWTRRRAATREVLPGVAVGSVARLPAGDTRQLVSLCAELQAPRGMACRCLPWLDLVPASPAALRRAAGAIDHAVRQGRPVVVGCALGVSRSVAALACWLARSGQATDLDDALARLRRAHPQLVLGPAWLAALKAAAR
ncbi:MAG: phosphatase [Rubrivivax sp.]